MKETREERTERMERAERMAAINREVTQAAMDRLARHVVENLPDSIRCRIHLLNDLLRVLPEEHPLRANVAITFEALLTANQSQLDLSLQFQTLTK